MFERLVIDLLRACSVKGAATLLHVMWDEAWGIKTRAATHSLSRRTWVSMRKPLPKAIAI